MSKEMLMGEGPDLSMNYSLPATWISASHRLLHLARCEILCSRCDCPSWLRMFHSAKRPTLWTANRTARLFGRTVPKRSAITIEAMATWAMSFGVRHLCWENMEVNMPGDWWWLLSGLWVPYFVWKNKWNWRLLEISWTSWMAVITKLLLNFS